MDRKKECQQKIEGKTKKTKTRTSCDPQPRVKPGLGDCPAVTTGREVVQDVRGREVTAKK